MRIQEYLQHFGETSYDPRDSPSADLVNLKPVQDGSFSCIVLTGFSAARDQIKEFYVSLEEWQSK